MWMSEVPPDMGKSQQLRMYQATLFLDYNKNPPMKALAEIWRARRGFELPTPWFVARYSIQLSYGRVVLWRRERDSNPRWGFSHTPLAGERLRPLGHLSRQRRRSISVI